MRILSIDLPWSRKSGTYGFAWAEGSSRAGTVWTQTKRGSGDILAGFAAEHGKFDVILIDQPIGPPMGPGRNRPYRPVERVFANSASLEIKDGSGIQAPRFQPGAKYAARGLKRARCARETLGNHRAVVVESFPQLSILPLLEFAKGRVGSVVALASHKKGKNDKKKEAARQLGAVFKVWTGRPVVGAADRGEPDAVDALLALLPALDVLSASGRHKRPKAMPCWLHDAPLSRGRPPKPDKKWRQTERGRFMILLARGRIGRPGIRHDGILALRQPGWPKPAKGKKRLL